MNEKNRNTEPFISDDTARDLLRSFRQRESSVNSFQERSRESSSAAEQQEFRRSFPDLPEKVMRRDYPESSDNFAYPAESRLERGRRFNQHSGAASEQKLDADVLPVRQYSTKKNKEILASDTNPPLKKSNQNITEAIIVEENAVHDSDNTLSSGVNAKKHIPLKISSMILSLFLFAWLLSSGSNMNLTEVSLSSNDRDSFFQSSSINLLSEALNEIHNVPRVYTLGMGEYLTPKPDATKFEKIEDNERKNYDGSPIDHYKDATIEVKCWKEKTKYGIITYAEVWIAHPSQFRRVLVDNVINKNHLDHPQNIFAKTNGVLGMSGDYCAFRPYGIEILYGNLIRDDVGKHLTPKMDILIYDTDGNFSVYESKKEFFETDVYKSGNIIHTLAFGPMLIDDYKVSSNKEKLYKYQNGRPWEKWPRAAICQFDYDKHYLLCRLGQPGAVMEDFAKEINKKGVRFAYALDGGMTGTIMFNKKIVNEPAFDGTRAISDIIYFATAVPEE